MSTNTGYTEKEKLLRKHKIQELKNSQKSQEFMIQIV